MRQYLDKDLEMQEKILVLGKIIKKQLKEVKKLLILKEVYREKLPMKIEDQLEKTFLDMLEQK